MFCIAARKEGYRLGNPENIERFGLSIGESLRSSRANNITMWHKLGLTPSQWGAVSCCSQPVFTPPTSTLQVLYETSGSRPGTLNVSHIAH